MNDQNPQKRKSYIDSEPKELQSESSPKESMILGGRFTHATANSNEEPAQDNRSESEPLPLGKQHIDDSEDDHNTPSPARRYSTWAIGAGIMMVIAVAFWYSQWKTGNSQLRAFSIKGNLIVANQDIERCVKHYIGTPMSEILLSDICDTLVKHPYIKDAIASKESHETIRLYLIERQPRALCKVGAQWHFIDDEGTLLPIIPTASKMLEQAPVINGLKIVHDLSGRRVTDSSESYEALHFLKALAQRPLARLLISEIILNEKGKWDVLTHEAKTRFFFAPFRDDLGQEATDDGERQHYYETALSNFETFWTEVVAKRGLSQFDYVDMRFTGKVFAKSSGI